MIFILMSHAITKETYQPVIVHQSLDLQMLCLQIFNQSIMGGIRQGALLPCLPCDSAPNSYAA